MITWLSSHLLILVLALLLEQWHPQPTQHVLVKGVRHLALWFREHLDTGEPRQAWLAWTGFLCLIGFVVFLALYLAYALHPLLGWVTAILLVYLCLGFRKFSHGFTEFHRHMEAGNIDEARYALKSWVREDMSHISKPAMIRIAIQHALISSHRHVFGVLFWYVLIPGVYGVVAAVLYRVAVQLTDWWQTSDDFQDVPGQHWFLTVARKGFDWIDYIPVRVTAFAFALTGNFETAMQRLQQAKQDFLNTTLPSDFVLIASGMGALGIEHQQDQQGDDEGLSDAEGLQATHLSWDGFQVVEGHLSSLVGLEWRTLIVWLGLILLMTLASFYGFLL
jgi:adenosylcobinamide-phosphate synthase